MIRLVTVREVIRVVRKHFLEQFDSNYKYPDSHHFSAWRRSLGEARAALAALDLETCTREDVNNAIGATGWADNSCDECHRHFDVLVRIGDEPDLDTKWVDLCPDCLNAAATLLRDALGK